MMWNGLKNIGKVCLLLLVFSLPALPVLAQESASSQDSDFLLAAQEIAKKYPGAKPMLLRMANVLQVILADSKAKDQALQQTIDSQASKLREYEKTIADLKTSQTDSTTSQASLIQSLRDDASDKGTSATVGWTLFSVATLGDAVFIVLRIFGL